MKSVTIFFSLASISSVILPSFAIEVKTSGWELLQSFKNTFNTVLRSHRDRIKEIYGCTKFYVLDVCKEFLLESSDLRWVQFVQVTSDTTVDNSYLLFNGHGN